MSKENVTRAIDMLALHPAGAELGEQLRREYHAARDRAGEIARLAVVGVIVVAGAVGFLLATGGDFTYVGEALSKWLFAIIGPQAIAALLVVILLVVGVKQGTGLYVEHRLCKFLDAHAGFGPADQARELISTRPAEALSRALAIFAPAILVVTGFVWAAAVWMTMTVALNCARSHKCV